MISYLSNACLGPTSSHKCSALHNDVQLLVKGHLAVAPQSCGIPSVAPCCSLQGSAFISILFTVLMNLV